jgi:AraC-like DNA-binding protein
MYPTYPIQRLVHLSELHTAFEQIFPRDYVFRGETHDFHEIVLVLEGSVDITADAASFTLHAPAAVLHPPMEFHSIRSGADSEPRVIIFSFTAPQMPAFSKRTFALNEEQINTAKQALALLNDSVESEKGGTLKTFPKQEKTAQRGVLALESLLLSLSDRDDPFTQKIGTASGRNYRRALRVVEENLTQALNTEDLARLAHMSPSLLKKTFARHAGVGVMEYFRTLKINAAIPLLRDGMDVKEISARLGFSSASYFSTVFRRVTGHTPGYYKNK